MSEKLEIRDARIEDAEAITEIYNHFVENSTVTFDFEPQDSDVFRGKLEAASDVHVWLVCTLDERVVAYSHSSPWKSRCAYERSVESSIYVNPQFVRRGIGKLLYAELLSRLERAGIHSVLGGIAQPNKASVAMHEKFGFERVGRLREVGYKFERWIDVEYWQKLFR